MTDTTLFSISRWMGARAPGEAQVIATIRSPAGFDAAAAWDTWNGSGDPRDFPEWLAGVFENVELVIMPGMVIPERTVDKDHFDELCPYCQAVLMTRKADAES